MNSAVHIPVMLNEAIEALNIESGKTYIDATFGRGGYSKAILALGGKVIAIDRDINAVRYAEENINDSNFRIVHNIFSNLHKITFGESIDGIVFDLGLCTDQYKYSGFSFKSDTSLDMNMGLANRSTNFVINRMKKEYLEKIISMYGEDKHAGKIANLIVERRNTKPFESSHELSSFIEKNMPRSRIHSATRTFQAIRIYVNDELNELKDALNRCMSMKIKKIVVVSFHSLEDRIVKYSFNPKKSFISPKLDGIIPDSNKIESIYKSFLLMPSKEEIINNKLARSAKLRYGVLNESL